MKEILLQLSAYHLWANKRLINSLASRPEEMLKKETMSSFPTIEKTFLHMWDAESIWWQRIRLAEHVVKPSDTFVGTSDQIFSSLILQNQQWKSFIESARPLALEHEFMYRNLKGEPFKQKVGEVLLHLFNHGTYHRGQVVTMMRGLGYDKIPQTDLVVFQRIEK